MIKVLLPLCVIFFIVLYMVFAFAIWDIAWVPQVAFEIFKAIEENYKNNKAYEENSF